MLEVICAMERRDVRRVRDLRTTRHGGGGFHIRVSRAGLFGQMALVKYRRILYKHIKHQTLQEGRDCACILCNTW